MAGPDDRSKPGSPDQPSTRSSSQPDEMPQGCPGPSELAAWRERRLPEEDQRRIEAHLVRCTACRATLVRMVAPRPQGPSAEQVWGSSIAVATFGPEIAPWRTLKALRADLLTLDATLLLEAEPPLIAIDTSSGQVTGDPVDARRLAAFIRVLDRHIRPGARIGAVVTADRGIIGKLGPFGKARDRAVALSPLVLAGELRLSQEVADRLGLLGVRCSPIAETGLNRVLPAAAAPAWELLPGADRHPLRALVQGSAALFAGLGFHTQPMRLERGLEPAAQPPRGDRLRIDYQSPGQVWLYLLLLSGDQLELSPGGAPLATPDSPPEGSTTIPLEDYPAPLHPILLASRHPVEDLEATIALTNHAPAGSAEERLNTLGALLGAHLEPDGFVLLPAPAALEDNAGSPASS